MRTAMTAVLVAAASAPATIETIYSNVPGHPTAQVPGVPGEAFRAPAVPFLTLQGSPDGLHWVFKAFTDNPDSNANDVIIAGADVAGAAVAKEGDPAPLAGLTYGFMDSDCGINDGGRYIFGNRLSGGGTADDEVLFRFDGTSLVVAAREGDPAPGLVDPGGAGDELFGNSLNSAHLHNDDTPAFKADLIQNVDSDFESALYHGAVPVAQEGTNFGTLAGPDVYDSFVSGSFASSADGAHWIVEADVLDGLGTEEAVVVDGNVEIRDGDTLGALASPVDGIFAVDMAGNGDWFARGDLLDGDAWAVRNGAVIAATGEPITPGDTELWADTLLAVGGTPDADFFVIGSTSAGRQVAVLNGEQVIARSGDEVALRPDTVFLEDFNANDAFLAVDLNDDLVDDRALYIFGTLRDEAFQTLGDAFLVVRLAGACPWDCAEPVDGVVGILDFLALLAEWGQAGTPCDFGDPGVDILDFLKLLGNWGPCP